MMCKSCKCCKLSWLSGMFALAAIVHIVRLAIGAEVAINGTVIPMNASIAIAVVAGILSLVLCKKSCASCGCGTAK